MRNPLFYKDDEEHEHTWLYWELVSPSKTRVLGRLWQGLPTLLLALILWRVW